MGDGPRQTWRFGCSDRQRALLLLVLGSTAILLLALRLRLPNLGGRPLGFDEAFHSEVALGAPDFAGLRRAVATQFQPLLDHVLRRYVCAPLLGSQELGIRLPAMLASLLAILASVGLAAWGFARNERPMWEAVLAGMAIGIWHAGYAHDIGASGVARHYALTGCLSILWTGLFVFGEPERAWKRFALCGLLFANTHFFSLSLLGTGYAFLAIGHLVHARRQAALREIAVFAAIVSLTAVVNWPALSALLSNPVEPRHLGAGVVLQAFGETWLLAKRFAAFLALPILPAVLWLLLVLAGGLVRELPRVLVAKVSSLALLATPGLFFLGSLRSGHHIEERYFMPFVGLAPLLLALGALLVVRLLERALAATKRVSASRVGQAVVLPLVVSMVVGGAKLAARPGGFDVPGLPSRRAAIVDALKREARPVFLLSSPCWTDAVVRFYWRFVGTVAPKYPLQTADQRGYEGCVLGGFPPGSLAEENLRLFLERAPDGLVVFYQHHLPCFRQRFVPPARLATDGTNASCLTILLDAISVERTRATADAVGYPAGIQTLLERRQSQYDHLHL
ncbi:MAG: hypothetical protein JXP73_03720 [Deltaproteobacteria bacterium]|nr:hypothetical protein [Deltaproteobacteria bacterium]